MIEWILINIVSPLLLPVFILMILAAMTGAKADSAIKALFEAAASVINTLLCFTWKLATFLLKAGWKILGCAFDTICQEARSKESAPGGSEKAAEGAGKTGAGGSGRRSTSPFSSSGCSCVKMKRKPSSRED